MTLRKLARFVFSGPLADNPAITDGARNALRHAPRPPGLDDVSMSDELQARIRGVRAAVSSYFARVHNADVSQRLTDPEKIYVADQAEYTVACEAEGVDPRSAGFCSRGGTLVIKRSDDVLSMLSTMQHELLHPVEYREFVLTGDPTASVDISPLQSGLNIYQPGEIGPDGWAKREYHRVSESILEMAHFEIVWTEWPKTAGLTDIDPSKVPIAYQADLIVMDEMIKRIADESGRSYVETFRELQSPQLFGGHDAVDTFTRVFGDNERDIANWQFTMDMSASLALAEKLGLSAAVAKLKAFNNHEAVQIMDDLVPGGCRVQSQRIPQPEVEPSTPDVQDIARQEGVADETEPQAVEDARPVTSAETSDPAPRTPTRPAPRRTPLMLSTHKDQQPPSNTDRSAPSLLASGQGRRSIDEPPTAAAEEPAMPELDRPLEPPPSTGLDTL